MPKKTALIPGSTPIHTYRTTLDTSLIDKIRITYSQFGEIVLQKQESDCQISDGLITVKLTQEDTLRFVEKVPVKIQGKIRTLGGEVFLTKVITKPCGDVIDREEL